MHLSHTYLVIFTAISLTHLAIGDDKWWDLQNKDNLKALLYDEIFDELTAEIASESKTHGYVLDGGVLGTSAPLNVAAVPGVKPLSKSVKPRQPESEDKIVPAGYQYMSGGAGEGKQHLKPEGSVNNKQVVKSDEDLPAYCSPPNPCPIGRTAADGCQENIRDTVEFNRNYLHLQMEAGYCSCDYEHMASDFCSEDKKLEDLSNVALDDYMEQVLDSESQGLKNTKNPYISVGEKRMSMTAKKGGKHVIHKRHLKDLKSKSIIGNPFLKGDRLPVVAKKSPKMV